MMFQLFKTHISDDIIWLYNWILMNVDNQDFVA